MLTAPRLRRQVQAALRGNLLFEALRDTLTPHQSHQLLRAVHHLGDLYREVPEVPESRRKLQHSLVAVRRFLKNEFRYVVILTARVMRADLDGHRLLKGHDAFGLRQRGQARENPNQFLRLLWNQLLRLL